MTSDELADEVVAAFNAIDDPLITFEAVNPPELVELEAEVGGFTVHVWPYAEGEEALDRADMCRETLQIDVYVHGPIDDKITRRAAIKFVKQLRGSLRLTEFQVEGETNSFRWDKNETVNGIYDVEVLKTKRQFLAMFRATYYSFA